MFKYLCILNNDMQKGNKLTKEEKKFLKKCRVGKIIGFSGSWGSGVGFLKIETKNGILNIPCENGATVRALESAFGNMITEGHTANGNGYKNKEIVFIVGDFGLLEGFIPVEEWDFEKNPIGD